MVDLTRQQADDFQAIGWHVVWPTKDAWAYVHNGVGHGLRKKIVGQDDGWVAVTPVWMSPPFADPWAAYVYAQVECWGEGTRQSIARGWLYLDDGEDYIATNQRAELFLGGNQLRVVMPQTMTVYGARVGDRKIELRSPMRMDAGDTLQLEWRVSIG
jgi:hypothetical protein